MSMFKEVQETDKPIETEKQRLSTAFENNKKNEGGETRHLKTINEQYEGQKYPGTDVEYKHERIQVNGEKVEGVFPQFESKDVERLPRKMWESSDAQPALESRFTPRQLEQIRNGEPRISGLTWHHTEHPGVMQLVNSNVHSMCRHTGGRSIWGGGSDCR